jgi:hypothetical protein
VFMWTSFCSFSAEPTYTSKVSDTSTVSVHFLLYPNSFGAFSSCGPRAPDYFRLMNSKCYHE